MDKKFLGIKVSTYITAFVCLIAAFLLWLCVNISDLLGEEVALALTEFYSIL